jgi:hypothetical protein
MVRRFGDLHDDSERDVEHSETARGNAADPAQKEIMGLAECRDILLTAIGLLLGSECS